MKKILLMSLTLAITLVLIAGASDKLGISESDVVQKDTLIYISDGYSDQPVIIEREPDGYILRSGNSLPPPPVKSGTILDVPVNDDCINAIEIGDVQDLPISFGEATLGGSDFITLPDIWYLYTASTTSRVQVITDSLIYGRQSRNSFAIYDGSDCPVFETFPAPVEYQGGETIETASPISDPLPVVHTGTTDGYVGDYTSSCSPWSSAPDVVYSYTATADDLLAIILCPSVLNDFENQYFTAVQILGPDGEELACQNYANYYDSEVGVRGVAAYNIPVFADETYYIIVSGANYPIDHGDYTLKVFTPDYNPINISSEYSESPGLIFDAIAGQQYLIEIGHEGTQTEGKLTIVPVPTPANENCENAIDGGILRPNETVQFMGDNTGALTDCPSLHRDLPRRHVWIKFTLEDTMDVQLDYCGNTNIVHYLRMTDGFTEDCPCSDSPWIVGQLDPNAMSDDCPNMTLLFDWPALPPGTYLYPMTVDYRFEGTYVINVTGLLPQSCSESTILGQDPTTMYGHWEFCLSDIQAGFLGADDFEGLSDSINQVSWWGMYIDADTADSPCEFDSYSYPFKIIFCEYNPNNPFLPGDTVEIFDVTASAERTGHEYYEWRLPHYKFTAPLDRNFYLERGWIIIEDYGTHDCHFQWQNSGFSGNGIQYDLVEQRWTRLDEELAFCLEFNDSLVAIDDDPSGLPATFELSQNYPNPFNARTAIKYNLAQTSDVTIEVYNLLGRKIETLVNEKQAAGYHEVIWNAGNVSSGIYFYKIQTSEFTETKKMLFLK